MNNKRLIASKLLEKGAVKLSPSRSFVWASGIKSPIYCDNRKLLSYPDVRKMVAAEFADIIKQKYPTADVIAGVATGAIAWGILTAEILNKPFIYVRSQQKKHGLGNRIEGDVQENSSCVVIEDLVSTGGSSISAVNALHDANINVKGMLALFSYDLPVSKKNFNAKNCELTTLTNFDILLEEATGREYINDNERKDILNWRNEQKV